MPLTTQAPSAEALARKPRDDEIDVFGLTHTGKVRASNNDHFLIASLHKRMDVLLTSLPGLAQSSRQEERVAIFGMIADGVGGSETGEEASRIALDTATDYLATSLQAYYGASDKEGALEAALQEAAMHSHASVVRRAKERDDARKRATTLTVLVGVWPWLYLLQVGDSRYYIFREIGRASCRERVYVLV